MQGVCYRASTCAEAKRLGVVGRVHNLADGGVEVVAQGEPEAVAALIGWLWKGPVLARVTAVRVAEVEPAQLAEFTGE